MKRLISWLLAAALLLSLGSGCIPWASAQMTQTHFTRENFPQLDGSTSMVPLGQGIASVLLGESREDVSGMICFNRTTQSFRNLRMGECDLVIAAEPKSEVFTEMQEEGFDYEIETIAREALVFVVNEDNPVSSLTREQVKGIYSGAITNWKEVGGEDIAIEAFQRNPTAGSQVMMEKLVMEGTPMMEAPAAYVPQEMGELIRSVRSFDRSANAIGYTVFYYASDMQMAKGLKILKIDGVLPCDQTIRWEEYPFLNGYYACISATEPKDSPTRRLYDWLVSEAGQRLLSLEGYVSVYAQGEAPASGNDVFTDESHYAPSGGSTAVYEEYPCPHDHLEPSDDYGLIFPYVGARLYSSQWEDEDYYAGELCGFYNYRGQLITNPIYTYLERRALGEWSSPDYFWMAAVDEESCGFVSKDGSVVSPMCYQWVETIGSRIVCIRSEAPLTFDIFDRDFRLVGSEADFVVNGAVVRPVDGNDRYWICFDMEDGKYCLMDLNGNVLMDSEGYIYLDAKGRVVVSNRDMLQSAWDEDLAPVYFGNETEVEMIMQVNDHFDLIMLADGSSIITDSSGSLFDWNVEDCTSGMDGSFSVLKDGVQTLYSANGTVLGREIPGDWAYIGSRGLYSELGEAGLTVHSLTTGDSIVIPDGEFILTVSEDLYSVVGYREEEWYERMMTEDLTLRSGPAGYLVSLGDVYTGEEYVLIYGAYGFDGEQRLMTGDGRTELFRTNGSIDVIAGHITVTNDWAFTDYGTEGTVVFCYPFYGLGTGD